MILLLHEDLANLFRHRVFSKRFTLPDAIAVIADGLVLVIEIIPKHVFRIFRRAYQLGSDHRHFAEIVDLPRENQGMIEDCRAVSEVLACVGDKWTVLVVTLLGDGSKRFNELRRRLGSISQRMPTLALKGLERDGLVTRTVFPHHSSARRL